MTCLALCSYLQETILISLKKKEAHKIEKLHLINILYAIFLRIALFIMKNFDKKKVFQLHLTSLKNFLQMMLQYRKVNCQMFFNRSVGSNQIMGGGKVNRKCWFLQNWIGNNYPPCPPSSYAPASLILNWGSQCRVTMSSPYLAIIYLSIVNSI